MKVMMVVLVGSLLGAGCAVRHEPLPRSGLQVPESWRQSVSVPARGVTGQAGDDQAVTDQAPERPVAADWWQAFGSEELVQLVARAQARNPDLAAAAARVLQAEADARIAGAALLPGLGAGVSVARQGRLGGSGEVSGTRTAATLAASYEVDLWGRLRATRDSARAILAASRFDRETVRLTVTAGVAGAWLQAVGLRERMAIGARHLGDAERLLALVDARARAGAATQLEVAQQRTLVATQRRTLAALQQQSEDALTALELLVGGAPTTSIATPSLADIRIPGIGAGLPVDLLNRRPDIARAEATLVAAEADMAAARAAMFPTLSLDAGVGTGGAGLRRLFDNPIYSLASALAAPIFDGGRLSALHDRAGARRGELLADYRGTLLAAFGDVEVSLNAVAGARAQAEAQDEELEQARRAMRLAESRYRAGAETLLTLLDTQRTLYAAQDGVARLKSQRLLAAVALYRALGGGWAGATDGLEAAAS